MPEIVIRETRILAEDEIIDISVTRVPVSPEIPDGIRYSLNYRIRVKKEWKEINFNSPKELIDELMILIE